MEMVLNILSGICLLLGSFFLFSGALGVIRFPDFYTRMHAAGVSETLATPLILIGLMLLAGVGLTFAKLVMILLFVLLTSPTASHALAKSARHGKLAPMLAESKEKSTR